MLVIVNGLLEDGRFSGWHILFEQSYEKDDMDILRRIWTGMFEVLADTRHSGHILKLIVGDGDRPIYTWQVDREGVID